MFLQSQHLFILTSPPASGKTYWISKLRESLKHQKLLMISPLRALADECRSQWGDTITVMTPEEWLGKKIFSDVVIFDEFHLFFYWGDSFRPVMWEVFFEISQRTKLCFLLTATLSLEMREEISLFECHFDEIVWLNHGNQILKYQPIRYLKLPSKKWMREFIETEVKGESVKLIFCQFRQEVFALEKKLVNSGYSCISCVGGESKFMAEKLRLNPHPDFIIATTVLSHGVNLPDIKRIYFLYEILNIDFWIQMVARGGRRGQAYEVFALEKPLSLEWNSWQNFISLIWLCIKLKFSRQSFPFIF